MVICLERGADLHMAQLMPLPLTVSCFSIIQIGFTFLAHLGTPGRRAVKWICVCVCVCVAPSCRIKAIVDIRLRPQRARSIVYFTFCTIAILTALNSAACSFLTCFSINTQYSAQFQCTPQCQIRNPHPPKLL